MAEQETKAMATAPAGPKPPLVGGGKIMAIVPTDVDQAYRLAGIIATANMAPKSYDRDQSKIMVGIIHGSEIGLPPMAALQSIAVINGMPTIWGDGALGVVRASGLLQDIRESLEGAGDAMMATCVALRAGQATPVIGRFSVADAKKAGLWGKQGPWTQYPQRMLQMRARSWCLRDGFADVLRGLRIAEEAMDAVVDPDGTYRVTAPPPRPSRSDFEEEPKEASAPNAENQSAEETAAALDQQFNDTMGAPPPAARKEVVPRSSEPDKAEAPQVAEPPAKTAEKIDKKVDAPAAWSDGAIAFPSAKPTPPQLEEWTAGVITHLGRAPSAAALEAFLLANKDRIKHVNDRLATAGEQLREAIDQARAALAP